MLPSSPMTWLLFILTSMDIRSARWLSLIDFYANYLRMPKQKEQRLDKDYIEQTNWVCVGIVMLCNIYADTGLFLIYRWQTSRPAKALVSEQEERWTLWHIWKIDSVRLMLLLYRLEQNNRWTTDDIICSNILLAVRKPTFPLLRVTDAITWKDN